MASFASIGLDGASGLGAGTMDRLIENNGDPFCLRPYKGKDGRTYLTRNMGTAVKPVLKSFPVNNVSGFLRKDDWLVLDQAIVKAAKPRLKAVADLRAAGLQFTIPNGLGKTMLDVERQSDMNEAVISMDGTRQSQSDRPVFDLQTLPLPMIHKDFKYSARQLMASRNGGSPLDTTSAELAARRVAEYAENLLVGVSTFAYEGGTIQGYTNFTNRLTKTMTAPTGSNAATTLAEVLAMRLQSTQANHFGPWMLYASLDWDQYLDNDYKSTYNSTSLRQRLRAIEGILDVKTLDFLPNKTMVLVQMTPDVARMVVGMEITTVQWETMGGMEVNFKVMCILVPQIRADYNGNTGVVHGTYT